MEFFRIKHDIPFMRHALVFNVISIVTFLIAVGSLATRGLNFGVDFTGGTVMEVHYAQAPDINKIRDNMTKLGFPEASVQNFGTSQDVLIRLPVKQGVTSAKLSELVRDELRKDDASAEVRRVEFVGPQVGKELVENGGLALLFVSIGIVTSIFSAVMVSRAIVNVFYGSRRRLDRVSIGSVWKDGAENKDRKDRR